MPASATQLRRGAAAGARRLDRLDQRPAAQVVTPERVVVADDEPRLPEDLTAERRPLVDKDDGETERGRLGARRHARQVPPPTTRRS